jgi:hypothetical protein
VQATVTESKLRIKARIVILRAISASTRFLAHRMGLKAVSDSTAEEKLTQTQHHGL